MDKLRELQEPSISTGKRNRALSVTRTTNQQLDRMEKSLDRLQSLLQEIRVDWPQACEPHCNPLEIALPLLDTTSVGLAHRKGEFIDLKDRISGALQSTVVEHYQAFNDSIGSYRTVVQNVANAKQTITKIEASINESANELDQVTNNEELKSLNENVKNYNEMIAICNVIEYLQNASNNLEACFADKNYSKAQEILTIVSKKANQYGLWLLPALSNLHEYYKTQEQQLLEILMEELHNVIYSKTDFTHMEIKSLKFTGLDSESSTRSNVEQSLLESINIDIGETAAQLHAKYDIFIKSFIESQRNELEDFNEKSSVTLFNYIKFEDVSNPFHQILKLLKLIDQLGNLQTSLEIITQRVANELNQLINKVIEDFKLKYPKLIKSLNTSFMNIKSNSNNNSNNPYTSSSPDLIFVSELFWNFFRKILFFFQSIKAIIIISETIQPSLKKNISSLESLKLWSLMKDETEKFILTYISPDESNDVGLKLTNSSISAVQDSSKLFQFMQVDYNKENADKLKQVLTNLFPGFINSKDLSKIDSPYIEDSKFLKQTRIFPANVMNMKYILEPFLLFIQGTNLLIMNDSTIDFFNEFMGSQFLPLLEEHLMNLFIEEVEEIDSFEIYEGTSQICYDNDRDESEKENEKYLLFFVEFRNFLNELCFTLNTSAQFRPEFTNIIFKVITKFTDKVEELHKELQNELTSFLEPNKDFILYLLNPTYTINKSKIRHDVINKNEYQNNNIIKNFRYLNNSLKFIVSLLGSHLIKTIEINKIDLNLSHIEKIRKSWSFLEINDMNENLQFGTNSLSNDVTSLESLKKQNKLVLNDELRLNYNNGIVLSLQKIQGKVKAILNGYENILSMI